MREEKASVGGEGPEVLTESQAPPPAPLSRRLFLLMHNGVKGIEKPLKSSFKMFRDMPFPLPQAHPPPCPCGRAGVRAGIWRGAAAGCFMLTCTSGPDAWQRPRQVLPSLLSFQGRTQSCPLTCHHHLRLSCTWPTHAGLISSFCRSCRES